jgi:hypothetical protein
MEPDSTDQAAAGEEQPAFKAPAPRPDGKAPVFKAPGAQLASQNGSGVGVWHTNERKGSAARSRVPRPRPALDKRPSPRRRARKGCGNGICRCVTRHARPARQSDRGCGGGHAWAWCSGKRASIRAAVIESSGHAAALPRPRRLCCLPGQLQRAAAAPSCPASLLPAATPPSCLGVCTIAGDGDAGAAWHQHRRGGGGGKGAAGSGTRSSSSKGQPGRRASARAHVRPARVGGRA